MKKVINITIGGIIFSVEEDAYDKLNKYFEAIKAHFAESGDSDEILSDIEAGVSEKLSAKRKGTTDVVSLDEVEDIIHAMGAPEDFDDFGGQNYVHAENIKPRRLYKNPDDVIIAGVASGIAAYIGIDPVIVRLLFVLSVFFGGFGAILYIILWIIVPEAKTTAQKLEMRGEDVTLSKISLFVERGLQKIRDKKEERNTGKQNFSRKDGDIDYGVHRLNRVFKSAGFMLRVVFEPIRIIVGGVLFMGAVLGLAGATVFLVTLFLGVPFFEAGVFSYIVSDFAAFPMAASVILFMAVYLLALVPLLIVMLTGLSILEKDNKFTLSTMVQFTFTWVFALMIVVIFAFVFVQYPFIIRPM